MERKEEYLAMIDRQIDGLKAEVQKLETRRMKYKPGTVKHNAATIKWVRSLEHLADLVEEKKKCQ